ncbi:helix-turn-helix protein [Pseudovibrio axinellae]|uniref:Helix-turn-helix protein n=1 Tax=Pseudovibrio axinellae TaxID=989403 RepID=A0A165XEL0_9HYPH|nr:helix-turn-helix transcriptional regulator [Pseudovibrio axinellae]KZL17635.1 helix-turn-helix protein [Pseudovibrio axinellae]SER45499.1 Transcriptional regulator, contains XRE-family HTH domain [Pseudovibrio axinellae]
MSNVKKAPKPVDVHVGSLIRTRRMLMGMTQEKLGDTLGITFQQIQKYEKGTNRVGSSRLQDIANALKVPVAFFFEGAPGSEMSKDSTATDEIQLLAIPGAVDLLKAFAVSSKNGQRSLINIAQQVAA